MTNLAKSMLAVPILLVAACQSGGSPTAPGDLTINPQTAAVTGGQSVFLTVVDTNGDAVTDGVSWSSSDPFVVSIDSAGVATGGYGEGRATITAVTPGASTRALVDLVRVCAELAPLSGEPNPNQDNQRFDVVYAAGTDASALTGTLALRYGFAPEEIRSNGFKALLTPTQAAGVGCAQAVTGMTYL